MLSIVKVAREGLFQGLSSLATGNEKMRDHENNYVRLKAWITLESKHTLFAFVF